MIDDKKKNYIDNEFLYKNVFDHSNDAIFIISLDNKYINVNKKASEMLDYEKDELIGKNINEVIVPEELDESTNIYKRLLAKEKVPLYNRNFLKKDGTKISCEVNVTIIFDSNHRPKFIQGIARDISDRNNLTKIIQESEEKYKKLFNYANDAIFLHKLEADGNSGKFIDVNEKACKSLGYTREELLQLSVKDISISVLELKSSPKTISELLKIKSYATIEALHITKDGKIIEVEVCTHFFTLNNEKVLLSIVRDISSRKKIEKERARLEERRKEFIAATSHELRTPVTSIKGYIEILRDYGDTLEADKKVRFFDIIDKQFIRLERLISDVSNISRIERGVLQLKKEIVNFSDFIEKDVFLFYENVLSEKLIYEKKHSKEEIIVQIDNDRIFQAISNIIDNAIKHTPENDRKIKISIDVSSTHVYVSITDNGAGIEEENLDRIFEQFYSKQTQYSIGGTGIGLYLSRTIVHLHRGNIEVFSEGKDRGTTFVLSLPLYNKS